MAQKGGLEIFKFSLYLSIPVVATVVYSTPETMAQIVDYYKYITYPAEGRKPPKGHEIEHERVYKIIQRRKEEKLQLEQKQNKSWFSWSK
ncbi:hypothetical protein TrLO_g14517 [Triparma laevis f. longispina]|nr:hypothetical protein TrLO_g14517 [Triparma laevis f. longispina]